VPFRIGEKAAMMIIRGERVVETATLTAAKELQFSTSESHSPFSFLEEECQNAFKRGVELGTKKGYEKTHDELKTLIKLLQTIAEKLLEQKQKLLDQLKPELIEFSITVCEKVIRKELGQSESFVKLMNSLLLYASSHFRHDSLNIVLSPEDLLMIEEKLVEIHQDRRESASIQFRSDPDMRRGDCRIETPTALLNYSISRELDHLQAKVFHKS
jgi:flagellar assembly protein FliH